MAEHIELFLNQSSDPEGVFFTIYRDTIAIVTTQSAMIATVDEANVLHQAFQQVGEVLTQDITDPFIWYTARIYVSTTDVTIYKDGIALPLDAITLSINTNQITISQSYDLTGATVTGDYWYLASQFIDDSISQVGVTYNGPTINPLNKPMGFSQTYDWTNYTINLSWALDPTPHLYYYAVNALDRDGYLSALSGSKSMELSVDPATISYIVQRSQEQTGPWTTIATLTDQTSYIDNTPTPVGHVPLQLFLTNLGNGSCQIQLINPWYEWQDNWRPSWYYQIYEEDDEGEIGLPTPDAPFYVPMNILPVTYILRRSYDTGIPATIDGTDAITIGEWIQSQLNPNNQLFSIIDSALSPDVYGYTTYIIDAKGYIGQPFYTAIDMR